MQILMLETRRGCADGFIVRRFYAGERYAVPESLGWVFVGAGWAIVDQTI